MACRMGGCAHGIGIRVFGLHFPPIIPGHLVILIYILDRHHRHVLALVHRRLGRLHIVIHLVRLHVALTHVTHIVVWVGWLVVDGGTTKIIPTHIGIHTGLHILWLLLLLLLGITLAIHQIFCFMELLYNLINYQIIFVG